MSIPETTSAEGLEGYVGGKCLFDARGEAWRDIKAWIVALPLIVDTLHLPSVSDSTSKRILAVAAKSHRVSIYACLKNNFEITRFFRAESFGNRTSVRNFNDVDYFATTPTKYLTQKLYFFIKQSLARPR